MKIAKYSTKLSHRLRTFKIDVMSDSDQRGVTVALSTLMLIALTLVFVGVVAVYITGFAPGPQDIAAELSIRDNWAQYPVVNRMEVSFEHLGGESIRSEDLVVVMSGTDMTGTLRNYRSDGLSAGMTYIDMVVPDNVFELGDNLKVTFTLQGGSYLFDNSKDAIVSLIYRPADQILVKGRELVTMG